MTTVLLDRPLTVSLPSGIAGTVGFFDGVHTGHRFLIDQLKKIAGEKGLPAAVITFPVHPRKVLDKRFCPKLLNSFEEKLYRLSTTGIDYCLVLDFTKVLSEWTAREFIQEELWRKLNVKSLLVGYDHRFGKNRKEGFLAYQQYGTEIGMNVTNADPLLYEQVNVSSTRIRKLLSVGEMEKTARLLSYHYTLKGIVMEGSHIGRTIGFPTANIQPKDAEKIIPGTGIYIVTVNIEQVSYKGMLYIGQRPTFDGDNELRIEVHLLDFSGDLYGKTLEISIKKFLRKDVKFDSIHALRQQLESDKAETLKSNL
jgi:riboflavin kinase/FMN adenylyltransferase